MPLMLSGDIATYTRPIPMKSHQADRLIGV
jgi:hypothetical protein